MKKIIGMFFTLLLLFQLGACGQSTLTWEEQYDLGVRYLSDGNYEEAIIAFTAAIDIDPKRVESYVSMAEAYQQQEEYDLAREILMRGYEETKSERLQNILDAIEANTVLSSNRELQESMERLYQSLKNGDVSAAADEFENWIRLNGDDPNSSGENKEIDISYPGLIFDGEKFYAEKEYKGVGLLFDTFAKVYYGEQNNGTPDGNGILLATNTWFPDGGIQFYAQSGTWVHGLSVGQAEIIDSVTSKHSQEDFWGWQISCTYDNQEVMDTADVTQICVIDGEEHEFDFHVAHGKLIGHGRSKRGKFRDDSTRFGNTLKKTFVSNWIGARQAGAQNGDCLSSAKEGPLMGCCINAIGHLRWQSSPTQGRGKNVLQWIDRIR